MHSTNYLKESGLSEEDVNKKSSSVYAAANVWTDGLILPQNTRQVCVVSQHLANIGLFLLSLCCLSVVCL